MVLLRECQAVRDRLDTEIIYAFDWCKYFQLSASWGNLVNPVLAGSMLIVRFFPLMGCDAVTRSGAEK